MNAMKKMWNDEFERQSLLLSNRLKESLIEKVKQKVSFKTKTK